MADISDRERLEKLAKEKARGRQQTAMQEQQRQDDEAKQKAELLAQDRQKTEDLFEYCKTQFQGYKLETSGHELDIGKAPSSRTFGIQPDGVDYVSLSITHWGEETNNFQGQIPLLLTRFRSGQYQIVVADESSATLKTFDQAKDKLIEMISDMDQAFMKRLFKKVRDSLSGR